MGVELIVKYLERPKLRNPIFIEGLPGIGLVGKLAADHMIDELKAKKFIEIYSWHFPPQVVILPNSTVKLVNNEFYYWHSADKDFDLMFLVGDYQGLTPRGQYQLAAETIKILQEFGVRQIFTLGGLGTGSVTKQPRVFGAATHPELVEQLRKYGVTFKAEGAIFGASGLLLALGAQQGMRGVCLMGETHGQIVDAKSAEAVLKVLTKILGVEIDMSKIVEKVKETERQIQQMVGRLLEEQQRLFERELSMFEKRPTYIR